MESAKEEEVLALEDARDAMVPVTAMVLAEGLPVTYGPQRRGEAHGKGKGDGTKVVPVNPFWSERLQAEARLRAMRPAALPDGDAADGPQPSGRVEPADEVGGISMDVKELLRAVMTQNAALKKELGELRREVKSSREKVKGEASGEAPRPPTSTPPPSPPKDPPPCTPVKGRMEPSNQAWADVKIPDFPEAIEGDTHYGERCSSTRLGST